MNIETLSKEITKLPQVDLDILHHFSSGVYARQMKLPAGATAVSHKHNYDHLSILASGEVLVETDEYRQAFVAPACITIEAGKNHAIHALKDVVWFCIHATDVADADKIDEVIINKEGN